MFIEQLCAAQIYLLEHITLKSKYYLTYGFAVIAQGPEGSVDKPFLWTEGRVSLRAALNKSAYGHGEHISVTIDVRNDSRKIIRKVRVSWVGCVCVSLSR